MEEGQWQERIDCSDSEMIPSSPREEAGPDIPDSVFRSYFSEIEKEQDIAANPDDSKKCYVGKRFESYDDMMAMINALKLHNHPLCVFNSQAVEERNKCRAKAKQTLDPIDKNWQYTLLLCSLCTLWLRNVTNAVQRLSKP